MAGSFNKVILVGRLTRDPEIKFTPSGAQLARFSLAVDRNSKEKATDFINIVAWQKLAEICGQYLRKGKLVLIEGELQTRMYETQEGQKRSAFEVVARTMQMLGSRREESGDYQASSMPSPSSDISHSIEEIDVDKIIVDEFDAEDMPF